MEETIQGSGAGPTEPPADETVVTQSDAPAASATARLGRGDSIGRFVVLGVLGSGGMGVVYSAYDPHLDRKVALKLLHTDPGRRTDDAGARLLREAQAMAKIDHPNVVRVHEVGMHGEQVYVAMEFADGGTLRAWLSAARRTIDEIVAVFAQAARGLAAAHAAGLVHRDFKPDNVLLDKDGTVRVTDFGIVTLLDEPAPRRPETDPSAPISSTTPLSEQLTRTGAILGTPGYMAPEQFRGIPATAATDQFAFAIALYDALYQQRPFPGTTYAALCESVLAGEVSPPPKSTPVPTWLRRVLVRALSREPEDRFPTMPALIAALARDPGRGRNRVVAIAGAAAIMACGVYVFVRRDHPDECSGAREHVSDVWNANKRARIRAAFAASKRPFATAVESKVGDELDGWTHAWERGYVGACEDTRVRATQSEHMLDVRMQCLARRLVTVRVTVELLANGDADAIDRALDVVTALPSLEPCADPDALAAAVAPPEIEVTAIQVRSLRQQLESARAELRLGHYPRALAIAHDAVATAQTIGYAPTVAEAMLLEGRALRGLARPEAEARLHDAMLRAAAVDDDTIFTEAAAALVTTMAEHTRSLPRAEEIAVLSEATVSRTHATPESLLGLQLAIVTLERTEGKLADARARAQRAVERAETTLGANHPLTLDLVGELGSTLLDLGRYDDARIVYERVLASRRRIVDADHPKLADALIDVARVYRRQGNYAEATKLAQQAVTISISVFGHDHTSVANQLNILGTIYDEEKDTDRAAKYYEEALAIMEKIDGPESPNVIVELSNLALTKQSRGDLAGALALMERALAICEATFGHDAPQAVPYLTNIGNILDDQRRFDEALAADLRAREIAERVGGPTSPDVVDLLFNEASVLKHQAKIREATAMTEQAIGLAAKAFAPDHPRVGIGYYNLAELQQEIGRHGDALESFRKSLTIFETKFGKDNFYVSYALAGIGDALAHVGRAKEAVPYLERSLAIGPAAKVPPEQLGTTHQALADALTTIGDRARAVGEARRALDDYKAARREDKIAEVRAWLRNHGS